LSTWHGHLRRKGLEIGRVNLPCWSFDACDQIRLRALTVEVPMEVVLAFVLAFCHQLIPNRDHTAFAMATAAAIVDTEPLFKNDADKRKTAALMVAIAYRESALRPAVKGDKGKSFGAFQIYLPYQQKTVEGWSGDDILANPENGARVAMRMIRESMHVCPQYPIAHYAEGGMDCGSDRAKRISTDRTNIAKWLDTHVKVAAPTLPPQPQEAKSL
jgi:hypothetical protein